MILGISTSGRQTVRDESGRLLKGVNDRMVKYVLEKTGEEYEYVSLAGKTINGCQACLVCAKDNVCVIDDDWAEIRDKMFEANAIVFGAPNYYGMINARGHAFLERTFSLRHRERFPLAGKLNAIVVSGSAENNPAENYIRKMFRGNYMAEPVGTIHVSGIAQCYTCGYGEKCAAGAVVSRHGFLDEIQPWMIPQIQPDVFKKADILAQRLGSVVRNNK
ncbi:flavodoxin family protein [Candidatus Bathyarchaeota archaeon]|nr:flavodoxin family protein [Candidatus Bathyarchaeota archaeon]MBT4319466.1 flavodoxin family protein [Candidatus Bathyarchaeota archaeon]MBT4423231.1 flavodoxin family protein [Candidatus Bathyarchaeota archaeon]MBT5643114.1 flavodoxin family protein [Candidatus Bathyarchaeota archaeon]